MLQNKFVYAKCITLFNVIHYNGRNFTLQSICSINFPIEIPYQYIGKHSLYIDRKSLYVLMVFNCCEFLYFNSHSNKTMVYPRIVSFLL